MNKPVNTSVFIDNGHKNFYYLMLKKCARWDDVYYRALFYTFGLCKETREHIEELFDFKERCIKQDALYSGWQTGQSVRLTLLAFNLWSGWTIEGKAHLSAPHELFNCSFAPFFWEAIRLRYPEYCHRKKQNNRLS